MGRGSGLVAVALASACTFGSPGGKGDSAGSIAGEDTGDDDGGTASASEGEGDDGASGGMSAGTAGPGSGPTSGGSETGGPIDPGDSGSGGPISTSGIEPTTSSSDGPADATMDAGSSDGGGGPDPYPVCGQEGQCPDGSECIGLYSQFGSLTAVFCGEEGCGAGSDCAAPPSGNAQPACVPLEGGGSACALSCENGETCPTGMACIEVPGPEYCGWDL